MGVEPYDPLMHGRNQRPQRRSYWVAFGGTRIKLSLCRPTWTAMLRVPWQCLTTGVKWSLAHGSSSAHPFGGFPKQAKYGTCWNPCSLLTADPHKKKPEPEQHKPNSGLNVASPPPPPAFFPCTPSHAHPQGTWYILVESRQSRVAIWRPCG